MSANTTATYRDSHWSGSLAFRLALLCFVLIVPLSWLGVGQYVQIHSTIESTRQEQRGLDFIGPSLGVLQASARLDPPVSPRYARALDDGLEKLNAAAATLPDIPVAAERTRQLRSAWTRAERSPDPATFAEFGGRLVGAIGDVADATRVPYEPQIQAADVGDALYAEHPQEFERLIAAYRTAASAPRGRPAPIADRIAISGYLARAEAAHAQTAIDMREAFANDRSLRADLAPHWQRAVKASAALHAELAGVLAGKPLSNRSLTQLHARRDEELGASAVFLGALHHTLRSLLDARLAMLDRADRILTSVMFAGLALFAGLTVLIVRAAGRRYREDIERAQRDAERLSAELARQRAERALLLTEAQFRAVFERSQMGIAMLARDGSTVESNGALRAMLGDDLKAITSGDDALFNEMLEGGKGTYQSEHYVERGDGAAVWVEVTLSPVSVPQREKTAAMAIVQDITERKAADDRLRYAASHDELTGLPNRSEFVRQLNEVLGDSSPRDSYAVLFVDLDNFKLVNDGLGHFAGDRVLAASARRLSAACRPHDVVARFHGDEFAILLRDVGDEGAALLAADRVQRELRTPISVGGSLAIVTSSVGIVTLHEGYADAEHVLRNADAAMYHAKSRGRSNTALFDDAMYQKVASHFRIASDLR